VQIPSRRGRKPYAYGILCFVSHFARASGALCAPISNLQFSETSSVASNLALGPVQNGQIRPVSRVRLPRPVWKPLPPSLLPLWQPVPWYACFLKFPSSIITTTRLRAPGVAPRDAAGLSLRASRVRFHPVARSASPCLLDATEPSALGTEN
jgi:hypothetical protein